VSRQVKIVLPEPAAARLGQLVEATGEPTATLAARLLKERLEQPDAERAVRTRRTPKPPAHPPTWLEPDNDLAAWRAYTWAAVAALHTRYPEQLSGIQDGWWEHPALLETLAALAAWRSELDQHAEDPRDELLFHSQLADYGETLRSRARGVAKAWQLGAPPSGWATS
jgi:hypothetical protein